MPILRALLLFLLPVSLLAGHAYAQMEDGNRGILPRDTEQVLEVSGIRVDTTGEGPEDARYNGWREAQRIGFARLWAEQTGNPRSEAPDVPDSVLDTLVNAIVVEREQIGPNRYIASLGVQFDRARTGARLGLSGGQRRSAPVLLIPVTVTGGAVTTVEQRNPWQRAWALLRTGDSRIDYVRVSGLGLDPVLVNAAVTRRPDTDWWTNLADLYGATNVLIAEASVKRAYPGGPAVVRFTGRVGLERRPIGSFTMTAADSSELPAMMQRAAVQMDRLFQRAFLDGLIVADQSLIPEEPPPPVEEEEEAASASEDRDEQEEPQQSYQVQIASPDAQVLDQALAALLRPPGVGRVTATRTDVGGVSSVLVQYGGSAEALRASLASRGWSASYVNGILRIGRFATDDGASPDGGE